MPASDQTPNRRTEDRRDWYFPVRVEAPSLTTEAVCRDVSARGMQLALTESIAVGTRVSLSFSAPGSDMPRTLAGRVARSGPNDDDSRVLWPHRAGIELDAPDEELAALEQPDRIGD